MVLGAPLDLTSASPAETARLAAALGRLLEPGDFVSLIGELGAGKTAFAGGLGLGQEVAEPLRSPSYLLCCEYQGRHRLLHLDAYFEARMAALLAEGLADRFRDAVVVVEWADHCAGAWPEDRLEVRLAAGAEPEERRLQLRATGPRSARLLEGCRNPWHGRNSPGKAEPERPGAR